MYERLQTICIEITCLLYVILILLHQNIQNRIRDMITFTPKYSINEKNNSYPL